MKKKIIAAILLSLCIACLSLFAAGLLSGCASEWYDKIKHDYAKQNGYDADGLSIDVYGEYNGTYVLIIDGSWGYPGVEVGIVEIGGAEFYFSSPRIPEAYNNGLFYSLEEAYGEQLLTHDDLVDVNEKFIADEYIRY